MERWNKRVVLVTGASKGIGAAICKELVQYGITVIGCARRLEKIEALSREDEVVNAPGKIHAVRCDLAQELEILAMFGEIKDKFGVVDVCINNAGFSTNNPLLSGKTKEWRLMLEVNVMALCICTREAVKLMTANKIKEGVILNIGSLSGHVLPADPIVAGFNFHSGTKFMVRCLTEGLRQEVKAIKSRIRVASISPSFVETEFFKQSLDPEEITEMYAYMGSLQAKDIVDAVVYILKSPPHVNISDIIVEAVKPS